MVIEAALDRDTPTTGEHVARLDSIPGKSFDIKAEGLLAWLERRLIAGQQRKGRWTCGW
jgi:hypothetical protein